MNLNEIEELCNKATPGPWRTGDARDLPTGFYVLAGEGDFGECEIIADSYASPDREVHQSEIDADFIARSRTIVPDLVSAVRDRDRTIGELRVALAPFARAADAVIANSRTPEEMQFIWTSGSSHPQHEDARISVADLKAAREALTRSAE